MPLGVLLLAATPAGAQVSPAQVSPAQVSPAPVSPAPVSPAPVSPATAPAAPTGTQVPPAPVAPTITAAEKLNAASLTNEPGDGAAPATPADLRGALKEVLRTRCAGGTAQLERAAQALGTAAAEAIATEVVAACREAEAGTAIGSVGAGAPNSEGPASDNTRPSSSPPGSSPPGSATSANASSRLNQSGRAALVVGSTLYGLWAGAAVIGMTEPSDARLAALPLMLGAGTGLGLSLTLTRGVSVTKGEAWTTLTGFDYGTYSGLLLAGMLDWDSQGIFGGGLIAGLGGGAIATSLARSLHPSQSDAETLRSGGLWGFATGALLDLIVQPNDDGALFGIMLAGMDGGLAIGAGLAAHTELSPARVLWADAGAIAGGATGAGLSLLLLGDAGDDQGRVIAAATLAGIHAGLWGSLWFTRDLDAGERDGNREGPGLALWERTKSGQWQRGPTLLVPATPAWGDLPEASTGLPLHARHASPQGTQTQAQAQTERQSRGSSALAGLPTDFSNSWNGAWLPLVGGVW